MKINKVQVTNLKAIESAEATFNGCHAIVTAGNGMGKTTMLRALIDRIRGQKPNILVHVGARKGDYVAELTDGSRIEWNFTEKSERITYITKEGIKQTSGVIKSIGERIFGAAFDIDKFLYMQPAKQSKELQRLVGIDFSEIDNEIATAVEQRKDAKKELEMLIAQRIEKPEPVDMPDTKALEKQLAEYREENRKVKELADINYKEDVAKVRKWNEVVREKGEAKKAMIKERADLKNANYFSKYILFDEIDSEIDAYEVPGIKAEPTPPNPTLIDTTDIERQINEASYQKAKAESYQTELKKYNEWLEVGKEARKKVDDLEGKVIELRGKKREMINSADIPEEFQFTDDGILYNELPLTKEQQATSSLYIAALKLGSMALGELQTMHFDASSLDKKNIDEILAWANKRELQLLIERPSYDGGEINYEIVEN